MTSHARRSLRRQLFETLQHRRAHPSRYVIVTAKGATYWPQPDELLLPGEVLLAPYDVDGASWDVSTLERALRRAAS